MFFFQLAVKMWYRELVKTTRARKLTFLYLANDIVQKAKKKYPEIEKEVRRGLTQKSCPV